LIGIISIVLLLWVERISNRLHAEEMLIDAVMDLQIRAATAHLRLDEIFRGEPEADIETVFAGVDQAIHLADVILNGGEAESDNFIAEPINNPELRARAEAIRTLLLKFKALSLERLKDSKIAGRGSSLYQQFHSTFREIQIRTRQLEDSLEKDEAEDHKKSKRLLLAIRAIWAFIVASASAALWNSERQRKRAGEELLKANEQLLFQAEELTVHRERLAELVEERTAELASTNEHLRAEISERGHVEVLLRESEHELHLLSARLMTAQETERRSISRELHDELGHALTIIKLRLRSVERGLQGNAGIKDECEGIMGYIDETIENVRRLSRDLSPAILEDLGLTAAIRWLVDNFNRNFDGNIALDMEDIDSLFSEDARIMIYRVIQEAITNIGKHADARDASVIVRQVEGACTFCIEDNGRGFNPPRSLRTDSVEKGLGLAIMEERVRMMEGSFEISSQEGKGTRIIFRLPTRKE
jgi:signal transduction histidine kinase